MKRTGRPSESPLQHNDALRQSGEHFGIWLRSDEAQRYVGCRTIKGWYEWRRRHGIVARNNGTVSRLDLDQALRVPRRRRMNPASLANLRRPHARQYAESPASVATSVVEALREA